MRRASVHVSLPAVLALAIAAVALPQAAPAEWDWGEVVAGKSYASRLRVFNKCTTDVVVSISHSVPGLSMPTTAAIPPGMSDVLATMTVPMNAHGKLKGQVTVVFPGKDNPPCLPGEQIYLVKGTVIDPGGGRGGGDSGGGGTNARTPGDASQPRRSSYDEALKWFQDGRDLANEARDAQLNRDNAAAHAFAAKALDRLQAARTALEEGLKNGDIGEQAGMALRDFIAQCDEAARKTFNETAPAPGTPANPGASSPGTSNPVVVEPGTPGATPPVTAPGKPTGPSIPRPAGGGTAPPPPGGGGTKPRPPAGGGTTARPPKPDDDDPRDEPPPVIYGEEIDEDGPVGVLVVRDDDDWVPWFRGFTTVTAKIYQRDARRPGVWLPSPSMKRHITLRFVRRSSEPGRNMNTDLEDGPQNAPDLFMGQQHHRGAKCSDDPMQLAEYGTCRTLEEENEYIFRISSHDDGAYGAVEAACDGCVALRPVGSKRFGRSGGFPIGIEEPDPEKRATLVPRDDNGNRISDGYPAEKERGTLATEDEDDYPKGNGTKGDGFSAYEEYRGFLDAFDEHFRTSWTRKNLFVENLEGYPLFRFIEASELDVVRLRDTQHRQRVVNYNHGFAHLVDQHALRLISSPELNDAVGRSDGLGPPKNVENTRIFIRRFRYGAVSTRGRRTDTFMPGTVDTIAGGTATRTLGEIVAHELGHGVGMRHHGDSKTFEEWWLPPAPAGEATQARGNRHTGATLCGYTLPAIVLFGHKHNQASGNLICLMRYPHHGVAFKQEDGSVDCRGSSPSADSFCERPDGTGWNSGDRVAGHAARGNCKAQIVVNDRFGGGAP